MKENLSREEFLKGIWRDNPVFVQVLGMCPMLAVTNSAVNALAMGGATFFVLVASSFLVSSLQRWIPRQVRISTYIIIIATFVTIADFTLQALAPDVHKELGAFISLIVVNCMILGRQEAFASKNPVGRAVLDAVGNAGPEVEGEITLNEGAPSLEITVANTGDRPVQVGSHYHFFETNAALDFDRETAYGRRLDIAAGTAVRFEPGQRREVRLIPVSGARRIFGFNQQVMGEL